MIRQNMKFAVAACSLTGAIVLAGCAGSAGPQTATLSGSQSCKAIDREMRALLAKGQGESERYRQLLNRYLQKGCYRS